MTKNELKKINEHDSVSYITPNSATMTSCLLLLCVKYFIEIKTLMWEFSDHLKMYNIMQSSDCLITSAILTIQ